MSSRRTEELDPLKCFRRTRWLECGALWCSGYTEDIANSLFDLQEVGSNPEQVILHLSASAFSKMKSLAQYPLNLVTTAAQPTEPSFVGAPFWSAVPGSVTPVASKLFPGQS